MTTPNSSFSPVRRTRTRPVVGLDGSGIAALEAAPALTFDEADAGRAQSAAMLASLARMQLRIDVLAKEQSDMFAKVLALVEEINDKLVYVEEDELESVED